jgi:hypothetical protein
MSPAAGMHWLCFVPLQLIRSTIPTTPPSASGSLLQLMGVDLVHVESLFKFLYPTHGDALSGLFVQQVVRPLMSSPSQYQFVDVEGRGVFAPLSNINLVSALIKAQCFPNDASTPLVTCAPAVWTALLPHVISEYRRMLEQQIVALHQNFIALNSELATLDNRFYHHH